MPLNGTKVRLREVRESDLPLLLALRNDLDTQGWSQTLPTDYTIVTYKKQFEEDTFSTKRTRARFVIETIDTNEVAGNISYYSLRPRYAVTIGIAIAKKFWSAGLAYDAQETLLHFLFEELGVRIVRLWTTGSNVQAIRLGERSGFKVAVRMREAIIRRGKLADNVVMDLLREEYYDLHPELEDHLPPLE
ncbi:MAG: GNAT family protein [Anaerolineales bacterium]|jgi:RimJ/RimL family protein N-acetyltransferase